MARVMLHVFGLFVYSTQFNRLIRRCQARRSSNLSPGCWICGERCYLVSVYNSFHYVVGVLLFVANTNRKNTSDLNKNKIF